MQTSHTAISHSKDGETSCGEELQSIEAIFAIYLHLFSSHNFLQFSNLWPSCRTHKNLIQLLLWFVSVSFCYKTNSTEFMMQFYGSIIWAGRVFFFFSVGFSWAPWCICSQLSGQLEVVWGGKSQDGCVCSKWSLILLQAQRLCCVVVTGLQNSNLQCTHALQSSVCSVFANVSLTNAIHFKRHSEWV